MNTALPPPVPVPAERAEPRPDIASEAARPHIRSSADARRQTAEINQQIEIWVNEGGAGGDLS